MKLSIACLIVTSFLYSCDNHSNEKIMQVFQPQQSHKTISSRPFFYGSGFCWGSIWLNSDSTFTEEQGCEGKSTSTIGRWYLKGDSIYLAPLQKGPIISFDVSLSKTSSNPFITFIVMDKTNHPIENFVIQPFNDKPDTTILDWGHEMDKVKKSSSTDSLGLFKIQKNNSDSLYFPKLYALTGKIFSIGAAYAPDTIKLMININGVSFNQYQIRYKNIKKIMSLPYIDNKIIFK